MSDENTSRYYETWRDDPKLNGTNAKAESSCAAPAGSARSRKKLRITKNARWVRIMETAEGVTFHLHDTERAANVAAEAHCVNKLQTVIVCKATKIFEVTTRTRDIL